ncbi:MAG: 2-oxoacid:acceptor oxidoreductase family protein [Cyclonatronaceae bacterium]
MMFYPDKPVEIRGHARGGQGMVTAFEMLAKIFSYRYHFEVQAFPFFGVERTGAPIQAYLRIAPGTILNRSYIYHPDLVVVFDEGLIEQTPVFDGLADGGTILINSEKPPSFYKGKARHICTVPATRISVDQKLGSRSLPIVNAAMVGALLQIMDADIELAREIIAGEVPTKPEANVEAAAAAFCEVKRFTDPDFRPAVKSAPAPAKQPASDVPFWDKPMSANKTGNWRVFAPSYVERPAPCSENCPAGTEVRQFVKLAAEGKFEEAFRTIYEHNPFPAICGRVCPHFCQQSCNRIALDGEVNIGAIERFIGDKAGDLTPEPAPVVHPEEIAVVGSGPAGLTAALRLRNLGYEVTVFEALPKAGGMMRSGIPAFRLPEDVLDREISRIEQQGVEIVTGKKVSVSDLEGSYAAIITAVGSHIGSGLRLGNENDADVTDGITFLREININGKRNGISRGERVAVIGGGNTAVDVARTVLRLGGDPVIYYRRTRNEMPAIAEEVEEAMKEGVPIEFLSAPVALEHGNNGRLHMTMQRMEMGEPDESGRRRPVPVAGSEMTAAVDRIITATGQWPDGYVFSGKNISAGQGRLDPALAGIKTPVFCAGDMAWGGTVVEAIGSGNDVAGEVDAFLRASEYVKAPKSRGAVTPGEMNFAYYMRTPGHATPVKTPDVLFHNFDEVAAGLTEEIIRQEADRCLHCGECYSCGNCLNFCPDAAISFDDENRLRINFDYCKGCGICVKECPCSAIAFAEEGKTN